MTENNTDKEWNRVKSNPDNVIMSDELADRLGTVDPDNVGQEQTFQSGPPTCMFKFSDYEISGQLLSCSNSINDNLVTAFYTISTSTHDATKLLIVSKLIGASIVIGSDVKSENDYSEKPIDVETSLDWPLEQMGMATVTISYDIVN